MGKGKNDQEISIDIESLNESLKEKMSGDDLEMPPLSCIFKVPTILSRHSPTAYIPNEFSFGPFHHYNLKRTEKIKSKYLLDLTNRFLKENPNNNTSSNDPDSFLKGLTLAITRVWKKARQYYGGLISMEPKQLVEVLVLDGCFIIEVFRKSSYESLKYENDPIFSMSCLHQFLMHDMILLENQVPWMVLEILFNLTKTAIDTKGLVQLALEFFATIFSTKPLKIDPRLQNPKEPHKHILDLLRNSLISPSHAENKALGYEDMHSATTLEDSGVEFKKGEESSSILEIRFDKKNGVLEIPPLFIQETTETVFRNLIGLEQCCPNYTSAVTSYAVFLDNLINTKEDMEILCNSKAIQSWLNVDDATNFFNKLYIDTYVKESFYLKLTEDLNEYCKGRWHRYRRVLMRDYFKHPWAFISVVAAFIALVLTFLQTLFTIMKPT